MSDFIKVATIDELPAGSMKAFEVGYDRVLLANTGENIYAVADVCTHDGAPISDGQLDGCQVVCPRHGARFDLATGAVKAPPAVVPIDRYEVRLEGNNILVKLDD